MLGLRQLIPSHRRLVGKWVKPFAGVDFQVKPLSASVPTLSYSMVSGGSKKRWSNPKVNIVRDSGGGPVVASGLTTPWRTLATKQDEPVSVSRIETNHEAKMLEVTWANGKTDIYPYVWLKDNCQCPTCFHPSSKSRIHLIQDLDVNIRPFTAELLGGSEQIDITWTDGHRSSFRADWLYPRAFNSEQWDIRAPTYKMKRSYWGTDIMKNLPRASFHELLTEDSAVLAWLHQLEVYGFALVSGAPAKTGQVRALAERVAFIKRTHYGEDFSVIAKNDPSNVAYLDGPLQLHADLPYYEYKPGVQFIHCIVQYAGNGGDTRVTDAVHVARDLQRLFPEQYKILTNTLVDWYDEGTDEMGEFIKVLQLPLICTDSKGEIWRINFSQPQRDSFFPIPPEKVAAWYEAMTNYHNLLLDPQYCFQFKMVPGTILTFDNLRIVHGRSGYKTGFSERHIEGCYIDWDEVRSRRRVLEKKLGLAPRQWVTKIEEVTNIEEEKGRDSY